VRDEALRLAARDEIVRFGREELGLELLGLAESPIKGREMGNVEYLSYWGKKSGVGRCILETDLRNFGIELRNRNVQSPFNGRSIDVQQPFIEHALNTN